MKKIIYLQKFYSFFLLIIVLIQEKINCDNNLIKVLIKKINLNESLELEFQSNNNFIIKSLDNDNIESFIHEKILKFNFDKKSNRFFLNNKKLKINKIILFSENNHYIKYENIDYEGSFIILIVDNFLYIINSLPIENYVAAVLAVESYPSWPIESHKMSAVMIRTYAYHKIHKSKNKIYNLKATIADQYYSGFKDFKNIKEAVALTKDQVLYYKKDKNLFPEPILSMYHICCGGIIPSKCNFNFKETPYLARNYACKSCKENKDYNWEKTFSISEVKKLFSEFTKNKVIKIVSIDKVTKQKSGALKYITLKIEIYDSKIKKNRYKKILLTNKEIRKIFGINLSKYSSYFNIKLNSNDLLIHGKGRGHHIGLCQNGAKVLINNGKTYDYVLKFYYPKTYIGFAS